MDSLDNYAQVSLSDRRRAIYLRVVERFAAKGIPLDDPTFRQLVEHWIADDITLSDAVILWSDMLSKRHARMPETPVLMGPPKVLISESRTELLAQIASVAEAWPHHTKAQPFIENVATAS
jgi:hypothetical protein